MNISKLYLDSKAAEVLCADVNWDPNVLPSLEDNEHESLRNDLISLFEEDSIKSEEKYSLDVKYGIKLKLYFDQCDWFTLRLAACKEFWIYLSLKVVPSIVYARHEKSLDYYYKKPTRIWLRSIWWYAFLSWQGDAESTERVLFAPIYSTDSIVGLTERSGRNGVRLDLYESIMRIGSMVSKEENEKFKKKLPKKIKEDGEEVNSSDTLFRTVMRLNTMHSMVLEPALCEGGVDGYVRSLFKEKDVIIQESHSTFQVSSSSEQLETSGDSSLSFSGGLSTRYTLNDVEENLIVDKCYHDTDFCKKIKTNGDYNYYKSYNKDILIFIPTEIANDIDNRKYNIYTLKGSGQDPRYNQDFGNKNLNENGKIKSQQRSNRRILIFKYIRDGEYSFFDEVKYEDYSFAKEVSSYRQVIRFTFRSLLRFVE